MMDTARKRLLALLGALALGGVAMGAIAVDDKTFPGVKRLMTDEDFEATGLDKLSAEEIEALDAWLLRYTAGDATVLQRSNKEVREATEEHEIVSRITGEFTGWTGKTVFRLENGQVWKQRLDGRYRHRGSPNPEVRIDRNWLGFYRMTVIETGRSVGGQPTLNRSALALQLQSAIVRRSHLENTFKESAYTVGLREFFTVMSEKDCVVSTAQLGFTATKVGSASAR